MKSLWEAERGRSVRLTSLPYVSRLSRQCGILNISLWASTACYEDSSTMTLQKIIFSTNEWTIRLFHDSFNTKWQSLCPTKLRHSVIHGIPSVASSLTTHVQAPSGEVSITPISNTPARSPRPPACASFHAGSTHVVGLLPNMQSPFGGGHAPHPVQKPRIRP
jgi:hypothetical protein